MSELRCLSFLPCSVCVHVVSMCPDKDHKISQRCNDNAKQTLPKQGEIACSLDQMQYIPFIVVLHNILRYFFSKENSWDLQPNKLNMALVVKPLTIQIPEVGSGSLLRDGGHVKLICGPAFMTSTQSASASSGPGYDDMTHQFVCVRCGHKSVQMFSGQNNIMFFTKQLLLNY